MSRSYTEARAAWQAWLHIHSIGRDHPVGFKHHCGTMNELDLDVVQGDITICNGCRTEVKHPEQECKPVYPDPIARERRPPKIRVLRVLEYTYDNAETAAKDMARWTLSANPRPGLAMKSVTFPFETIPWDQT